MKYNFLIATLVLCLASISTEALAKKKQDKTELAQINGTVYFLQDFQKKRDKKKHRINWAITRFRTVATMEITKLLAPECSVQAEQENLDLFFDWWTRELKRSANHYRSDSIFPKQAEQIEKMLRMVEERAERPLSYASEQVSEWQYYNCLQAKFNGAAFYEPTGSYYESMARGQEHNDPSNLLRKKGMIFRPHVEIPTPIAAIGTMMQKALDDGVLVIADDTFRDKFMNYYLDEKYRNRTPDQVADKMANPYWRRQPATP